MIMKSLRLEKFIEEHGIVFYCEHNDFVKGNIFVQQEAEDLCRELQINDMEREECILKNSVWSMRFYYGLNKQGYEIVYAPTFEKCLEKFITAIEAHYEIAL